MVRARSDDNDMDRVTPIPTARGLPLAGNLLALLRDMRGFVTERYLELGPVYRIRVLNRRFTVLAGRETTGRFICIQRDGGMRVPQWGGQPFASDA